MKKVLFSHFRSEPWFRNEQHAAPGHNARSNPPFRQHTHGAARYDAPLIDRRRHKRITPRQATAQAHIVLAALLLSFLGTVCWLYFR